MIPDSFKTVFDRHYIDNPDFDSDRRINNICREFQMVFITEFAAKDAEIERLKALVPREVVPVKIFRGAGCYYKCECSRLFSTRESNYCLQCGAKLIWESE